MKTANLKKFITDMNFFIRDDKITFPLTQPNVDKVIDYLEDDLSPENLHCDGEISYSAANRKYTYFMSVYRELVDYCKTNDLTAHNLRI